LTEAAGRRGIGLIGDMPIFVAHQSADVWAHQRYFMLDAQGRPTFVAGCPPDAFNADGQLWGNALYDWVALGKDGYGWWIARLERMLELFDAVRLDHFIGFTRFWRIPASAKTAKEGRWIPAPGAELFSKATSALGLDAPFIAEDLGEVTPEVRALRDRFGFPGMKVLQFACDGTDEGMTHRPHAHPAAAACYVGTHDNDTARGWFDALRARARRDPRAQAELSAVRAYFGVTDDAPHWDMIRAAYTAPSRVAVAQAQDVLGLGAAARMNVPGLAAGNWSFRLLPGQLTADHAARLAELTRLSGRIQAVHPQSS
jgi:4-alpha-glucanotransferase